jgi:hypothetical protein
MLDFEGHESNYMFGLPLTDNASGFSQPDGEDSNSSIADSITGKCFKSVCFRGRGPRFTKLFKSKLLLGKQDSRVSTMMNFSPKYFLVYFGGLFISTIYHGQL